MTTAFPSATRFVVTSAAALVVASAGLAQTPGGDSGGTPGGDPDFQDGGDFQGDGDFATTRTDDDSPFDDRQIVHPVTSFNVFADAYVTTDVRVGYYYHAFSSAFPLSGGTGRVYDLQARVALTDEIQIALTKAGFQDQHFGSVHEYGGTDAAFAVKYAPLQDWENDHHVAVGLGYEQGTGDSDVFGLAGDDHVRFFAAYSGGQEQFNYTVTANGHFSTDRQDPGGENDSLSIHAHLDYTASEQFSPLLELSYYKTLSEGSTPSTFQPGDLGNLSGNESFDLLTVAAGAEFRLLDDLAIRAAYESPLSDDPSTFGYRWTFSALWKF